MIHNAIAKSATREGAIENAKKRVTFKTTSNLSYVFSYFSIKSQLRGVM